MEKTETQNEILSLITDYYKLSGDIALKKNEISNKARVLLAELRKLDNWEVMIEHCKEHYEKYPDQFFDWCYVKFNKNIVSFVKNYGEDYEDYYVLSIKLDKPLEDQIKEREAKNKKNAEKEEAAIREKELAELNRLKEKYEKE